MGITVIGGTSGSVAEVGVGAALPVHMTPKPIPHGALGHYRLAVNLTSISAMVANARIFELRNPSATTLVIPTRLTLRALQTAAGTAQANAIDVYKVTSFSAVDTTNVSTPTPVRKRTAMPAPTGLPVWWNSSTVNGMTGGTLTKDQLVASLPYNVSTAISTTTIWGPLDVLDDVNGTHPFVCVQNEGFIIENRTLNVTSYGITWYLDFSWAETTAF